MKPKDEFCIRSIYCNMIYKRSKKQQVTIRLSLVRYAQKFGIKAAAREFGCSKNTVRVWKRRYEAGGTGALIDRSRTPKTIPHKTDLEAEEHIIACRRKTPCFGPKRLKWFYPSIKASVGSIYRILKQQNLIRKSRKKHKKKQDLRAVKAAYKALSHNQEDVKHLYDIDHFWPQMMRLNLPKYQYTIRDTKSGMVCLAFGNEYSEYYSKILTEKYLEHLKAFNVPLNEVTIQTDNGTEFGASKRDINQAGFVNMIEMQYGAKHVFIPPGMCNANADVESIHATIEHEFYDLESFNSRQDFLLKAQAYQYFYNMVRPNFSKAGKAPLQIIQEDRKEIDPRVFNFPVIDLDALSRNKTNNQGGQYVHKLPET